jgi:hypothetical protein
MNHLLQPNNPVQIDNFLLSKFEIVEAGVDGEPLDSNAELVVTMVHQEPGVERSLELRHV